MENNWKNNSIAVLEKQSYNELALSDIPIIKRVYNLVKIPVGELTVEGLRMLISQQIGLPFLVLLALNILDENILAEGDYYPGDLLDNMISIDQSFWNSYPEFHVRMHQLINDNLELLGDEGIDPGQFFISTIKDLSDIPKPALTSN